MRCHIIKAAKPPSIRERGRLSCGFESHVRQLRVFAFRNVCDAVVGRRRESTMSNPDVFCFTLAGRSPLSRLTV